MQWRSVLAVLWLTSGAGPIRFVNITAGTTTTLTAIPVANDGTYLAYTASLAQVGNSGVSGEVTIFITPRGLVGVGSAKGLEPDLKAAPSGLNCTTTGSCGAHIHAGTACTYTSTQGVGTQDEHYYDPTAPDPWVDIKYNSTDGSGRSSFMFSVVTNATAIDGKPFVLHDSTGLIVACGILSQSIASEIPTKPSDSNLEDSVVICALGGAAVLIVGIWWCVFCCCKSGPHRCPSEDEGTEAPPTRPQLKSASKSFHATEASPSRPQSKTASKFFHADKSRDEIVSLPSQRDVEESFDV